MWAITFPETDPVEWQGETFLGLKNSTWPVVCVVERYLASLELQMLRTDGAELGLFFSARRQLEFDRGGEAELSEGLQLERVVEGRVLVGHRVRMVALPPAPPAEARGQHQGADQQEAGGGAQPRQDEHEAGLGGEGGARPRPARGPRPAQPGPVGRLDAHAVGGGRRQPVQRVLPRRGVDVRHRRLVPRPALRGVAHLVAAHHRIGGAPADQGRRVRDLRHPLQLGRVWDGVFLAEAGALASPAPLQLRARGLEVLTRVVIAGHALGRRTHGLPLPLLFFLLLLLTGVVQNQDWNSILGRTWVGSLRGGLGRSVVPGDVRWVPGGREGTTLLAGVWDEGS